MSPTNDFRLKQVIAYEMEMPIEAVDLSESLHNGFGMDSLLLYDTMMAVEDEFGLRIPDNVVETFKTGQDILNYIDKV